MPRRDPRIVLRELLDAARKARLIYDTHKRPALDEDWESAYALRLALQIAGEAAGRLAPPLRAEHPQIPWDEIIGLRHVLVHGYDSVDLDILWRIAERDIPPLIEQVERLLAEAV
jgi:uncharacterized protein with HEPN domain